MADALYSQIAVHAEYGGVVPELASRDHIRKTLPLVKQVFAEANITASDLDGVAYTAGPGLAGALLVGAGIARSLAYGWDIPAVAVHHMEGHLLAPMLEDNPPEFPFVALLVSGGHTMLVKVEGIGQYELLGDSLDDAAGEAFDKTAKMLGLTYPGGPAVAKLAEKGEAGKYKFPRPMCDRPGLDFSFSGLKTFTLNTMNKSDKSEQTKADIACAFETAVVETLAIKCRRALQQTESTRLVIAGGVSANTRLRQRLEEMVQKENAKVYYPRLEFCTDNGAMIAFAGCQRLVAGQHENLEFHAKPRWDLESLPAVSNP